MENQRIIFKGIVGSQAYGTSTPNSDIDIKGVYIQNKDEILGFGYKEQVNVNKDETYYEVRRFLQLIQTGNPTMLELLYLPEECVIQKDPIFDIIIENRDKFLTKMCRNSFGGYAISQIKKAKGLDKKMNWEKDKISRKGPSDFTYALDGGKSMPLDKWAMSKNVDLDKCGLVSIDHFQNTYALYEGTEGDMFNGIHSENGNEVNLSSIPKGRTPLTFVFFNKEGYSTHCKDYREYESWLKNRNVSRYVDVQSHGQQIDGKNLLHCRRLIDMAIEIAELGTISVKRPNSDYLLKIRKGQVPLDEIINQAEIDIERMNKSFDDSNLPKLVDENFVNDILLKIRNSY